MGAPVTLTPGQFAKTAAAGKGSYQSYLKYVTNARARGTKYTPVGTGLEQTTPQQMKSLIDSIVSRFGGGGATLAPKSEAQIQQEAKGYAQSQTQPIIDQLTAQAQARAKAGMGAIGSLSKDLIQAQQPAENGYAQDALRAAAARSGISAGLAGQAEGQGAQAQSDVAAKLAQMGAGAGSDVFAQNAGALGKQIGLETASRGATSAADAINRGQAESERASALPGIASLAAIRSGRLLQEQTNSNLSADTGKITASLPGLVSSIFENLKSQELTKAGQRESIAGQKAGAALNLSEHLGDQNVQKALAKMGLGEDLTKLGVTAGLAEQGNAIKQQNANTAAARVQQAAEAAAAKGGKDGTKAHAATSRAVTIAGGYLDKTVKPQPIYKVVKDPLTGTTKTQIVGYKGVPAYYDTIHAIESRVTPILGPYLSQAEIIRFVQGIVNANPHYKAGISGRPAATAAPQKQGPPAPGKTTPGP